MRIPHHSIKSGGVVPALGAGLAQVSQPRSPEWEQAMQNRDRSNESGHQENVDGEIAGRGTSPVSGSQDIGRRDLLKAAGAGIAALGVASATSGAAFGQATADWAKTFPKSDRVDHQKVSFC